MVIGEEEASGSGTEDGAVWVCMMNADGSIRETEKISTASISMPNVDGRFFFFFFFFFFFCCCCKQKSSPPPHPGSSRPANTQHFTPAIRLSRCCGCC